jgi:hypothetical protein
MALRRTLVLALLPAAVAGSLLFFFCREEGAAPSGERQRKQPTAYKEQTPVVPDYEAALRRVLALQDSVRAHPRDRRLVASLLKASFDTTAGSFVAIGKGLTNPSLPEGAWEAARKTAAKHDGTRWALYLKAWHTGDTRPFGEEIHGEVMYSKVLLEHVVDDTLYQLLQIPVGSIVVP